MLSEPERAPSEGPAVTRHALSTTIAAGEDLTAAQRKRMELRAKERRRLTPKALALRVDAVGVAYKQEDRAALCGELENLASACMAWARYIRSTRRL